MHSVICTGGETQQRGRQNTICLQLGFSPFDFGSFEDDDAIADTELVLLASGVFTVTGANAPFPVSARVDSRTVTGRGRSEFYSRSWFKGGGYCAEIKPTHFMVLRTEGISSSPQVFSIIEPC